MGEGLERLKISALLAGFACVPSGTLMLAVLLHLVVIR